VAPSFSRDEAVQAAKQKGFAGPLTKQPSGGASKDIIVRWGCLLPWSRTVVAEQENASENWDPRWQLRRASRTKRCTTTNWAGRVISDTVYESTEVTDHLGRLHSARIATYERGQLVSEAAALYLPQGLAGKAVSGSAAAGLAAGAVGAAAMAGALGALGSLAPAGPSAADAAGSTCAVGYVFADGKTTFGVLKDPEAVGLPRQRAISRAAYDQARQPPWQPSSAGTTPRRSAA
jgi:hypothetical protein